MLRELLVAKTVKTDGEELAKFKYPVVLPYREDKGASYTAFCKEVGFAGEVSPTILGNRILEILFAAQDAGVF